MALVTGKDGISADIWYGWGPRARQWRGAAPATILGIVRTQRAQARDKPIKAMSRSISRGLIFLPTPLACAILRSYSF